MTSTFTQAPTLSESMANELIWLLQEIHREVHDSISTGLEESLARLCAKSPFKLVMSSTHTEQLKGTVTRVGSVLTEAELAVRMSGSTRAVPIRLRKPFYLTQIVDATGCIGEAIQNLSRLDGKNSNQTQLYLDSLLRLVKKALDILQQPTSDLVFPHHVTKASDYGPEFTENLTVDFYVSDNAIIAEVHDIEPESNMLVASRLFRRRGPLTRYNDIDIYDYDHVRVESQDPNLISVTAKLSAVETHLHELTRKLTLCRAAQTTE